MTVGPPVLFERYVFLIIADDPYAALVLAKRSFFNDITGRSTHPKDITVFRYFEGNVTVLENDDDFIAHGSTAPFRKGHLVCVGSVFRNLALRLFCGKRKK